MYGGNLPLIHALRRDVRAIEPLSFGALMRNRGALIFMAVWLLITLATGAVGFDEGVLGVGEQLQIAWEAHIGGFLGGLFAFYLLDRKG
jgi:membrane associated rhomboid family serine protease